jgi:hypothetical protein
VVAWKQPAWKGAILAEYTYCKADPRRGTLFFLFFFGFSSIRDTVLLSPPRSFKQQLLLPDKRTHDHYQQQRHQPVTPTVSANQPNF